MGREDRIEGQIESILTSKALTVEMKVRLKDYYNSLHSAKATTKLDYLVKLKKFGEFLMSKGVKDYKDIKDTKLVDEFLAKYDKVETRNSYISCVKTFYKRLRHIRPLRNLKPKNKRNLNLSPSQLLSPEEVVKLANAMPTEMNKALTLTLFESAARISEVLDLRIGDVEFNYVRDKENKPSLMATLHFGRAKGNVLKQPVVLTMFAAELKHWIDYHPQKEEPRAHIFYSTRNPETHIDPSVIWGNLRNAGLKAGVKKKVNPHWLRHSMLSYLANKKNYNEQLLMWRAGWTNTSMARRYIHSGGEIERKEYLARHGFKVAEKEKEQPIKAKPCPHCMALNPYTEIRCSFCGMPLDLYDYQRELEKRKKIEAYARNLENIRHGRLSHEQRAEIDKHIHIIESLREEEKGIYLEKLLETWTKAFMAEA